MSVNNIEFVNVDLINREASAFKIDSMRAFMKQHSENVYFSYKVFVSNLYLPNPPFHFSFTDFVDELLFFVWKGLLPLKICTSDDFTVLKTVKVFI